MPNFDPRRLSCRWPRLCVADLDTLIQIEEECFPSNSLTRKEFGGVIKSATQTCLMIDYAGESVGYLVFERSGRDVHVLSLAVRPCWQLKGVARHTIKGLAGRKLARVDDKLIVAVSELNLPSQKFFRAIGFKAARVSRGYYDDGKTDAFIFEATYKMLHGHDLNHVTKALKPKPGGR